MEFWLREAAENFWLRSGHVRSYPRDIQRAIAAALPAAVVRIPRLWTSSVQDWLTSHNLNLSLQANNRCLHGCVVAYCGRAFIFVDGTDCNRQLRFTLSHEAAHLIIDYLRPREKVTAALGPQALEILNGERPATHAERINAVLAGITLGVHTHFMDRGQFRVAGQHWHIESRADRLALELLAPEREVWRTMRASPAVLLQRGRTKTVGRVLTTKFGIPTAISRAYADVLCEEWLDPPSVREWVGMSR
jgi:hypothetical protein